jgi:hypothetical protein
MLKRQSPTLSISTHALDRQVSDMFTLAFARARRYTLRSHCRCLRDASAQPLSVSDQLASVARQGLFNIHLPTKVVSFPTTQGTGLACGVPRRGEAPW